MSRALQGLLLLCGLGALGLPALHMPLRIALAATAVLLAIAARRWPQQVARAAIPLSILGLHLVIISDHLGPTPQLQWTRGLGMDWRNSAVLSWLLGRRIFAGVYTLSALLLLLSLPATRRLQRVTAAIGASLIVWIMVQPQPSMRDRHIALQPGQSGLPVLIDGVLTQRSWQRQPTPPRAPIQLTAALLESEQAIAEVAQGMHATASGATLRGLLWSTQQAGTAALIVLRVILLPVAGLAGIAALAGRAPLVRWVRGALLVLLVAPPLLNLLLAAAAGIGQLPEATAMLRDALWSAGALLVIGLGLVASHLREIR